MIAVARDEDLDEAISLRREALEVPHPSRPDTLSALARYLQTRYRKNQSIGDLEEAIYMEEPEDFKIKSEDRLVYRLRKSLYRLKQAPC